MSSKSKCTLSIFGESTWYLYASASRDSNVNLVLEDEIIFTLCVHIEKIALFKSVLYNSTE